jgi:mono/diheme cytochrome c family protein
MSPIHHPHHPARPPRAGAGRPARRRWWAAALLGTGLAAAALAARADGGVRMPQHVPPAYTQECASCHTAYPPGLLPARSWQRVMSGLERHYGTDASLDAQTLQQINTWLQAHAGTYKRAGEEPPQDRIIRSAWFERKHRDIDPAVWKLPSVKSAANCTACHAGADRGRFDDHDLRMPAGLDARQRRAWND